MAQTNSQKQELRRKRFSNMKSVLLKYTEFLAELESKGILSSDISKAFLDSLQKEEKEVIFFVI